MPPFLRISILAAWMSLGAATRADAAEPVVLPKDAAAFDWLHPESSRCAKVAGALRARLTSKQFTCAGPSSDASTASSTPLLATCSETSKKREFLVFATLRDCKAERDTQLANAE